MADNTIELVIKVIDQASDQLDSIKDTVTGLGDAMKTLGPIAAAVGASFSLGAFLDEVEHAQSAQAQLNSALAATGNQVGITRSQLDQLTATITANSTANTAQVQSAEAVLLTFNKISGDAFPRVIQAASDLSARFGVDLVTATRLLGRALEEPLTGMNSLQRMGVTLGESQKDLVKAFSAVGDEADAQDVILSNIEARFKGAADAATGTLGGALTQLKKAFADLFDLDTQQTGGLIDSVTELKNSISDPAFKEGVQTLASLLTTMLSTVGKAASEATQTVSGLKLILGTSDPTSGNVPASGNPVFDIDNQILLVQASIDKLKGGSAFLFGFTQEQQQTALDNLITKLNALKSLEDQLVNKTPARANAGGGGAKPVSDDALNQMIKTQTDALTEAQKGLPDIFSAVEDALSTLGFENLDDFQKQLDAADTATQTATEKIVTKYATMYAQLDLLRQQGLSSDEVASRETALLAAQSTDDQKAALDSLGKYGDVSAAELDKQFQTISLEFGKSTQAMFDPKVTDQQKKAVRDLQDVFVNLFENMNEGVDGFLRDFLDAIKKIVEELIASKITSYLFGSTTSGAGGTATSGVLSGVLGSIFGTGAAAPVPAIIPGMAAGGIASGGLVNVGENGPEKVLLPAGARVFNRQQWNYAGLGGGGGGDVNYAPQYNVSITANDGDKTKAQLVSYIEWRSGQDKQDLYRKLQRNGFGTLR